MHITVTFRHLDSTDAVRDYAEEKSEHFTKYLEEPIEVHWVFSVEKVRHFAEATVTASGVSVNAKEENNDMYAAIDKTVARIKSQVLKHKEKIKNHRFSAEKEASASEEED